MPKVVAVILPLNGVCQMGGTSILIKEKHPKKDSSFYPANYGVFWHSQINLKFLIENHFETITQNRRKSLYTNDLPLNPPDGDFLYSVGTTQQRLDFSRAKKWRFSSSTTFTEWPPAQWFPSWVALGWSWASMVKALFAVVGMLPDTKINSDQWPNVSLAYPILIKHN